MKWHGMAARIKRLPVMPKRAGDIRRIYAYFFAAGLVVQMLWQGKIFSWLFLGAVALGGLIALSMYISRKGEL
jgi:hypothetical protein